MSLSVSDVRREFRPMLALAAPLALAELGWMAMGIVDTVMAGPLGAVPLGAGLLGTMVFYPIATALMGLLLGMDTLVAQSHGEQNPVDCRRSLIGGIWLAVAITPVVVAMVFGAVPLMYAAGANRRVMAECVPYMDALLWGLLPLYLFTAFRRYLQA